MAKPGPESNLNDEMALQIRKLVLDGNNYETIKHKLEIPDGTWDSWLYRNVMDIRVKLTDWKHERMIKKAELNIEVLQESEDEKVNLQANTFVLETLGKKQYSKRTENDITSGGRPIIQVAPEIAEKNAINTSTEDDSERQP